ncbi:MAG: MFS transporter [Polyangiaceae bacterium]|nr:MFS transporter [Polyangiaceae bacterium]
MSDPDPTAERSAAEGAPGGAPEGADRLGFLVAFALTWTSYAGYYLGRKGLSVAKSALRETHGAGAKGLDTMYLAMYAVGQFASGTVGDRLGARRLIGIGMLLSAGACIAFGLSSLATVLLICMMINGIAQSTGWPGNVKAMAEWVPSGQRGRVMGIWSTCYQIGGIAATAAAAAFMNRWGHGWAFIGPGLCMAVIGVLVLLFLRRGPLAAAASRGAAGAERGEDDPAHREAVRAARGRVLRNKTVWCYGGSYFCIKLIRYSLLFWLPYYLEKVLHYDRSVAGYLSTPFEIGGVAGTLALGYLSDKFRRTPRSIFAAASLAGLAAALWLYLQIGGISMTANIIGMALVGALLFGPDALLSGAAAQDAGGPLAAAMAAGVVNGIGSIGAVAQELVTSGVSERWGWTALFQVFLALSLAAAALLVPTFSGRGACAEEEARPTPA